MTTVVNEEKKLSQGLSQESQSSTTDKEAEIATILSKYTYPKKPYIYLYIGVFLSFWRERIWSFAVPLILATIYNATIFPPATIAFFSTLALLFVSSFVHRFIDKTNRLKGVRIVVIVQSGALFVASIALIYLIQSTPKDTGIPPYSQTIFWVLFTTLTLVMSIFSIASYAVNYLTREWIQILCNTHPNPNKRLSDTNRKIRLIDVACKMSGPLIFSVLCYFLPIVQTCLVTSLWFFILLLPELILYKKIYRDIPQLALPKATETEYSYLSGFELTEIDEWRESENTEQRRNNTKDNESVQKNEEDIEDEFQNVPIESPTVPTLPSSSFISFKDTNIFVILWRGRFTYFGQNVLPASLAFVLLFLTVFTPGALLIAYLKTRNISDIEIAIFHGLFSTFGTLAVYLTPLFISKLGLEVTGIYSIWFYFVLIITSLCYFIWPNINVWFFVTPLILSRVLWCLFEFTKTQIFGVYIKEQEREAVLLVESSLSHLMTLLSFAFGIILSNPTKFLWLVVGSIIISLISAICYTIWARRSIVLNRLMRRVNDFII